MVKRFAVGLIVSMAVAGLALAAPARVKGPRAKPAKQGKATRVVSGVQAVGTVTYDTGANNAGFFPPVSGINVGNRFNTDMGGPLLMTGQLTMVTLFPQTSVGYVTAFGPPNGGGTAANLGSFQVGGMNPGAFNAVAVGPVAVGPDFLAGAWLNGGSVDVGMDNMSVGGQGFHAFQLTTNFPGDGTGFQNVASRNALVRATGNILVPVELMNFSVQ